MLECSWIVLIINFMLQMKYNFIRHSKLLCSWMLCCVVCYKRTDVWGKLLRHSYAHKTKIYVCPNHLLPYSTQNSATVSKHILERLISR
jgi:hypothetical protein